MTVNTLDVKDIMKSEGLATAIGDTFSRLNMLKNSWMDEKQEIRNYIFATSTRTTSNGKLDWSNSTTLPKLCQIRDNLHANYMAALFPNDEWLIWEGDTKDSVSMDKAKVMESFVYNKTRASKFKDKMSRLVYDWIDYGNMFGTVEYVNEQTKIGDDIITGYAGPKLVRISPNDIVFDPTAPDFESSPQIVRTIKSLGQLKKDVLATPENSEARVAFSKALEARQTVSSLSNNDQFKDGGYQVDGFTSFKDYLNSQLVEVLTFYGDLYDVDNDVLYEHHIIQVIDRSYVLSKKPNPCLFGSGIFHQGWRYRPDNLYAMGPLDNLVGMQYRIDHLENLKADAFDLIAYPMMVVQGDVEEFDYEPGKKIFVGDEGSVNFMHPDVTALNADTQISILENKMEEMAGAPRQAMGIRTPGEKTAFEIQTLENSSGRIFQNKTLMLEGGFLTDVLNMFVEVGRRYMTSNEIIKTISSDINVVMFEEITPDDLKASGKIRPVGASHFAKRAQLVQNIVQLLNSPIGMDSSINVHLSGIRLAKAAEDILGLEKFQLFGENIRVIEQMDTQRLMNAGKEQLATEDVTPGGVVPGDGEIPE